MKDKIPCSACGKEVFEECMAINRDLKIGYSMYGDLIRSAGPYHGGSYHVCYECWFKSLGIPVPDKKEG